MMSQLKGKRILLTRTPEQNQTTATLLAEYGATPIFMPCLNIENLDESIQNGLNQLKQHERESTDIIFSSSNGVYAVASQVIDFSEFFAHFRLVAIGNKTAKSLCDLGCEVHLIPKEASQQGLISTYKDQRLAGKLPPEHIHFFRAEEGSDDLSHYFETQGISLTLVPSYQTSLNTSGSPEAFNLLRKLKIDAVLIGSAKTAGFYVQKINNLNLANNPAIAVMSEQVAQAADKLGLNVQVIANKPSFRAMLDGLNTYFAQQR